MKQRDRVNKKSAELIKELMEFCMNEGIENPKITMNAKATDGEEYRLVFERIDNPMDELYEKAKALVIERGYCSTKLLKEGLDIGDNKAGMIIDQLEVDGIISPFEGSKERRILNL